MKKTRLFLGMSVLTCLFSCEQLEIEELEQAPVKTILAYCSADNNLNYDILGNLNDMVKGLGGSNYRNCNILAFVDGFNAKSFFLNIHNGKAEKIFTFNSTNVKQFAPEIDANQDGNLDSANPATLKMAIGFMLEHFPNREYGLILSSHGGGWVPRDKWLIIERSHSDFNIDFSSATSIPSYSPMMTRDPIRYGFFADDSGKSMETEELVDAIPDHLFDFILFDACYMGSVEVAYSLRNKARYFISSPTEVLSEGFPYKSVAGKLANGYLIGACRDFYSHFNRMNGERRHAEVSLVRTEGLDSLANCFKKIVSDKPDVERSDSTFSKIQNLDRFDVFYDLGAVARTFSKSEAEYNEFRNQLDRCVMYAASTPELFVYEPFGMFDKEDQITVTEFSGLSVYIPFKDNDNIGLNESYAELEWSKVTDYK